MTHLTGSRLINVLAAGAERLGSEEENDDRRAEFWEAQALLVQLEDAVPAEVLDRVLAGCVGDVIERPTFKPGVDPEGF